MRRDALTASIVANKGRLTEAAAGLVVISSNPSFSVGDTREYILTSALLTGVSDQFDTEMKSAEKKIEELEKILDARKDQQQKLNKTAKKYAEDKSYLDKLMRTRALQNEKIEISAVRVTKEITRPFGTREKPVRVDRWSISHRGFCR